MSHNQTTIQKFKEAAMKKKNSFNKSLLKEKEQISQIAKALNKTETSTIFVGRRLAENVSYVEEILVPPREIVPSWTTRATYCAPSLSNLRMTQPKCNSGVGLVVMQPILKLENL